MTEISDKKMDLMLSKLSAIDNSLRTLNKSLMTVVNHLNRKNSTPSYFFEKRIQIAIDELFEYVQENMHSATFVTGTRLQLKEKAMQLATVDGVYLEFGVYKGQSLTHMAEYVHPEIVFGFDSFEGLPEDWGAGHTTFANAEFFGKESFRTEVPEFPENVKLFIGWFDQTIDSWLDHDPRPIAYLHVDCDIYSSAKTVLDGLKDRIVPGTVIVFDEYFGYFEWKEGEYKAFQEFVQENSIKYKYLYYRYDQVALMVI